MISLALFVGFLNWKTALWKSHFLLNEIKVLSSYSAVPFTHLFQDAFIADSLAKNGVDRAVSLFAFASIL